jgi:sugar phosphate isomerase/epimerase
VSGSDALEAAAGLGGRLAHVHMADGTGIPKDEHLVPGRGTQPCAPLLRKLAADGYSGTVVLEVNPRKAATRDDRLADLAEALDFTRRHLASPTAGGAAAGAAAEGAARSAGSRMDAGQGK